MSNVMDICFSSDKNYLHYLYITIASLLKSSKLDETFNIYILQSDFSSQERKIINRLKSIRDFNLEFLDVDESKLLKCKKNNDALPLQAYYRFLITDLKPDLEKVLYIDPDIEITGSLNELWNTDINNKYIAAVTDIYLDKDNEYKNSININVNQNYFNAGVILMNLKEFRKNDIVSKLIEISSENKDIFKFGDQDALNYVCGNNAVVLDSKYNCRVTKYKSFYECLPGFENAIIRHFVGKDKYLFMLLHHLKGYPIKQKIKVIVEYFFKFFIRRLKYIKVRKSIVSLLKNDLPQIYNILKKIQNIFNKIKMIPYKVEKFILLNFTFSKLNKYIKTFYAMDYHGRPKFLLKLKYLFKSTDFSKLQESFNNKSVAIIGNAESLLNKEFGSDIDKHDIVIRINRAKIIKPESQGTKTDIWATTFNYDVTNDFDNKYTLWLYPFFHGRKNFPITKNLKGELIQYKYNDWYNLYKLLGFPPTSGLITIDFFLKYINYKKIDLYGFDFFKTLNLYEMKDVSQNPHDFSSEEEYVLNLIKNNNKINLNK